MTAPEAITQHGLTADEYAGICVAIGREPNQAELGIFAVMWSEHCSYKSSKALLRHLPTTGSDVLQGPGENAGIIALDPMLAIAFKMESHNHPSFIEPYQGAATGVGGILRDIFTMGARPIASANSLRFGAIDHPKTSHYLRGVVAGIGGYGNCMGVPTVAGEVVFDHSYNGNILVNAMTIGIVPRDRIMRGIAEGIGNPLLYVGATTGRDGIHGATMASAAFGDGNETRRPTVQVGDPFTEKLLLEACLEAFATGAIVGVQDMGAAGLTSSAFEMAGRAGTGLRIACDRVPQRESGMTPDEILLSESQERMLCVVTAGREEEVRAVFAKWDLEAVVIGEVTDTGRVVATFHGETVVDLPVAAVVHGAPVYERPRRRPAGQEGIQQFDPASMPIPRDCNAVLRRLLADPNIASKEWVFRQYDSMVGIDTVVGPGSDAGVLRVKGSAKGIAVSCDGNHRYCTLDPYWGAALAVAEAARNVVCSGARPVGFTDCLNFGSPERPEVCWQFEQCILGMAEAARQLGTPVVSGNVSFYNETDGVAIAPTPIVGMVGILDDIQKACRQSFVASGDTILLLGENMEELGGSSYLATICGQVAGRPPMLDFSRELAVGRACLIGIQRGLIRSAHDCSDGGLAVALAECCVSNRAQLLGARITLPEGNRVDGLLFGETASRILVTTSDADVDLLLTIAKECNCPASVLGTVGGRRLKINDWIDCAVDELADCWWNGLEQKMGFL